MGLIAQRQLTDVPHVIHMTPGVQGGLDPTKADAAMGDQLGQQYNTPRRVIFENGTVIGLRRKIIILSV